MEMSAAQIIEALVRVINYLYTAQKKLSSTCIFPFGVLQKKKNTAKPVYCNFVIPTILFSESRLLLFTSGF